MVIREVDDGSTYVSTQEEHAELSAQFAAHWGNDRFAQLRPLRHHGLRHHVPRQRLPGVGRVAAHERGERPALRAPRANSGIRGHGTPGLPAKCGMDPRARPLRRRARFHASHRPVVRPLRCPDQSQAKSPRAQHRGQGRARRTRGPATTGQGHSRCRQPRVRRRSVDQLPDASALRPPVALLLLRRLPRQRLQGRVPGAPSPPATRRTAASSCILHRTPTAP